jgi:riboflavin synthase
VFTGIVEQTGVIHAALEDSSLLRIGIRPSRMWLDVQLGESIAVNGACLTVISRDSSGFEVELSEETRAKTVPKWAVGCVVNLERSVRVSDRLGGHLVSGHVDGVGSIVAMDCGGGVVTFRFEAPLGLARFLVPKGSVAIDGVSLTVVDVGGPSGSQGDWAASVFSVCVIPHTLQVTSLKAWRVGSAVNLEADQVAKYLERLVHFSSSPVLRS